MKLSPPRVALLIVQVYLVRLLRDYIIFAIDEQVKNIWLWRASHGAFVPPSAFWLAWESTSRPGLLISEAIYATSAFALQFWLDHAFPTARSEVKVDEKDIDTMQRLIASGHVQRSGIRWGNLTAKCALENIVFTGLMGFVIAAFTGRPFSFFNAVPALVHIFTVTSEPLTSIPAYLLVSAAYRVQARDIAEVALRLVSGLISGAATAYADQASFGKIYDPVVGEL